MNYVQHMNNFFHLAFIKRKFTVRQSILYLALFYSWNKSKFKSPLEADRNKLKQLSQIKSNSTYFKTIKDLELNGLIKVEKNFDAYSPLKITFFPILNDEVEGSQISSDNSITANSQDAKSQVLHKNNMQLNNSPLKFSIDEIKQYFISLDSTEVEAFKFFNHFESVGWISSSKLPIVNWKSAANKWVIRNNEELKKQAGKPAKRDPHQLINYKDYAKPI